MTDMSLSRDEYILLGTVPDIEQIQLPDVLEAVRGEILHLRFAENPNAVIQHLREIQVKLMALILISNREALVLQYGPLPNPKIEFDSAEFWREFMKLEEGRPINS